MPDIVRPCCWICIPKCSPPETPRFYVGFGELCFIHLGVRCKDGSNILGPDWGQVWPFWALLSYLGGYCYASWGKVGGSVGLFCSAMLLLLHPEMLSPSRTKILSGFLRAMWGQFRRFWGCVEGYMGSFWACCWASSKTTQR